MSFAFFLTGIITTIYINFYNPYLSSLHIPMLLIFYSAMELLQSVQYLYVNECSNNINKLLTDIAYVFIILQPLLWNYFFYLNSSKCDKNIFMVAMVLSIIWGIVFVIQRLVYNQQNEMNKINSVYAGSSVCTRKNATHLFWEWPMANLGDFNPTMFTYLMLWFVPALLTPKHRLVSILLITSALFGGIIAFASGEYYIFTSAWCYISVPIVMIIVLNIWANKNNI